MKRAERLAGVVQDATEIECTLSIGETEAILHALKSPWSNYRVLFESGRLAPGRVVEVVGEAPCPGSDVLRVKLPTPPRLKHGHEKVEAEVLLHRPSYVKKNKHRLQSVIYALLEGGEIARIETMDLRNVEESFPTGTKIPLTLTGVDTHIGMYTAEILWDAGPFAIPRVPALGSILVAPIIWGHQDNAKCLLDDRVIGYIQRDVAPGGPGVDPYDRLHPGNLVQVKIVGAKDQRHGTYPAQFLQKVSTDPIIDSEAERKTRSTEEYVRDASFRLAVIETYDHRCCVCGARYVVQGASGMQAAHVIPRHKKGANTLKNGLCLCPIHHWAFDRALLTIDESYVVRVADAALSAGEDGVWLSQFDSKKAHISEEDPVSPDALKWHRSHVFSGR